MRIGLREMKAFSKLLFSSVKDSTFFESCGVADLITTCCKEAHICVSCMHSSSSFTFSNTGNTIIKKIFNCYSGGKKQEMCRCFC